MSQTVTKTLLSDKPYKVLTVMHKDKDTGKMVKALKKRGKSTNESSSSGKKQYGRCL